MGSRRFRILFRGSHERRGRRDDPAESLAKAEPIASALGDQIIRAGFDLILSGNRSLDSLVGQSAVGACADMGIDASERIRTYPEGQRRDLAGFGAVLQPDPGRWQDIRTFLVHEADAIVTLVGGKGTADCIQKAALAAKPVFPIAVAGGESEREWRRLRDRGSVAETVAAFLGDRALSPERLVQKVLGECIQVLSPRTRAYSRRIFVVHGHDGNLKGQLARLLERLRFEPIILHEQPDRGRTIIAKLRGELADVGYAFVLLTPDDLARAAVHPAGESFRARQNVIFEHGLLVGLLGQERVCAVVSETVEIPSDLHGVLYKQVAAGAEVNAIAVSLIAELRAAGYEVDANLLFP
jgi:hypothetical protein